MSLYYVSESNIVSSMSLDGGEGSWFPDAQFGNYSTAVDTRSLSISLFPTANTSSNFNIDENSTTNVALLFYENANEIVSALIHRLINIVNEDPQAGSSQQDQWIDITSQESQALPNEFRNPPGFNYSNTLYQLSGYNTTFSRTLHEADPVAVYNTPFVSGPYFGGSVGAMFYSPFNLPLNAIPPLAKDNIFTTTYTINLNASIKSSLIDIHHLTPHTEHIIK